MTWVCSLCQAGSPAEAIYANVLVFGTEDMQQVQVHEREVCSGSPVTNATNE